MEEAKLSLRHFVREKLNVVSSPKSSEELCEALAVLSSLLIRPNGNTRDLSQIIAGVEEKIVKQLFIQDHYYQVIINYYSILIVFLSFFFDS